MYILTKHTKSVKMTEVSKQIFVLYFNTDISSQHYIHQTLKTNVKKELITITFMQQHIIKAAKEMPNWEFISAIV